MTNTEAIKVLEQIRQWTDYPKEALTMAIEALSKPELLSNLDEAARKYGREEPILPEGYNDGDIPLYERWTADAFKAGAEWMAGQFQKIEGELVDLEKEIKNKKAILLSDAFGPMNGEQSLAIRNFARHFYELGLNARKK